MRKSKFTESQIMAILKQNEAGILVPELCREHGISSASFYKWRSKYGRMAIQQISNINEKENILFAQWEKARDGFVYDGVANEQEYLSSERKILYLLKEVNDLGGGGWDLREYMREGARPQTWNNITRWTEGIRSNAHVLIWKDFIKVSKERRTDALNSIAAINLKKSPGSHTTVSAELHRIATEDKYFLNQQFKLYNADIIICCGSEVTYLAETLIDDLAGLHWKSTSRGIEYAEYVEGKYIIAYSHPEARVADNLLFYALMDAVREIDNFC